MTLMLDLVIEDKTGVYFTFFQFLVKIERVKQSKNKRILITDFMCTDL